jgi:hypothetical protein
MPILAAGMGPPVGGKVEVEFTPGVWTDVTTDVDNASAFTIKIGRTSEFSSPTVGTLTGVRLDNTSGRYTPLCQVLADGSANPNYPDVEPLRRIRYSNTPMGTRFVGKIKGWPPFVDANGRAWVMLSADDRLSPLAGVTLRSPIAQEVHDDAPVLAWPLTEPAGSLVAVEGSGGPPLTLAGGLPEVVFGEPGPGVGDGTGIRFAPSAADAGRCLRARFTPQLVFSDAFVAEVFVNAGTVLPSWAVQNVAGFGAAGHIYLVNGVPGLFWAGGFVDGPVSIADGAWHHLAVIRPSAGTNVTLAVDGTSVGDVAYSDPTVVVSSLTLGEAASGVAPGRFSGRVGYAAVYDTYTNQMTHFAAADGYHGEAAMDRLIRLLGCAGLTAAEYDVSELSTGSGGLGVLGTYPQAGKSVLAGCQDVAVTDGGGAVFYAVPDGRATYVGRKFRKPGPPTLTMSATADLDADSYGPSFDALTLANSCRVSRAASSGTLSEQSWTDQASVDKYGLSDDSVTSYSTTDGGALRLAQSRVARNARPGFRLGQVGVDLASAANDLYAAAAAVRIGSRIRVVDLPAGLCPVTQVDVIAEGWTETVSVGSYAMTFDTTPADNPPRGVWDDTTYGRWGCDGQSLNAAITKTASTLVVATTAGLPTFTMVGARYPLDILIEREVITLTAAPNQAASPQTFTGCLRGQKGTPAAPQASAATVALNLSGTFTL